LVSKQKKMGLWMATALVIGNVIGSGIFMLPASLVQFGIYGISGWVLTGIGSIALALVFGRLSHRFPKVGGPYAYSRYAYGDFVGFQVAWGYWIAVWVSTAALVITAVSYAAVIIPPLADPLTGTLAAVGIVWFFTLVNMKGTHTAGALQVLMTLLKLIPIVLIGLGGWFFVSSENFLALEPQGVTPFSALAQAGALTLFAFIGIESATIPANDVDKPHINIPRATIIGTVVCAVLYVLVTAAVMGIVPPEVLSSSKAPFVDAVQRMVPGAFSPWVKYFVIVSALVSCLGATNGWILLQAQVPFAAAKDNLFPKIFGTANAKGVPMFGLISSSVFITIFLFATMSPTLVEQFNTIAIISVFTILVPYLYSSVAEVLLIAKGEIAVSPFQQKVSILIALIAFCYALWAMAGSGETVVLFGMLFLLASIPIYTLIRRRRKER
jgi:APA family basic amino acid/polyamine antiporter